MGRSYSQRPILGRAMQAALEPAFWLHPPDQHAAYKLKATIVTKQGLLANADWVHRRATLAKAFVDNGTN